MTAKELIQKVIDNLIAVGINGDLANLYEQIRRLEAAKIALR